MPQAHSWPKRKIQRPCRKFSHRIQLHRGLKRPNICLHNPLFGLSETPPRSSLSCSPSCSVRCRPRSSDRCGLSCAPRCGPGCCPGYWLNCSPRYFVRCSTPYSTGRSDRCGRSYCPRSSPRSSVRCVRDCSVNCHRSCCPSCSVHCLPDCGCSHGPGVRRDRKRGQAHGALASDVPGAP